MKIQGTKIRGLKLYSSAATVEPDSYFNLVSLLLPGNGTNGAQNNTFLDSSTNNFTVTRNGTPTQGTFSPFSQTGWSGYFDGTDSLTIPTGAFSYTSGTAFTFECWVYRSSTTGSSSLAQIVVGTVLGGQALSVYVTNTGQAIYGQANVTDIIASSTGVISLNQWYHIAISKNASNTVRMWVNGTSVGTATDSTNYAVSSMYIGRNQANTQNLDGYVSNLRSVVGSSVYDPTQTTITVPTSPLTAISGTSLLTCQSNRFVDNSTNAFAITRNGDTSVQPFSPFNPDAAYSTTSVGGSGFFGVGNYFSLANNAALTMGDSDFTIEAWAYPTAFGANDLPFVVHRPYVSALGLVFGLTGGTGTPFLLAGDSNTSAWNITLTGSTAATLNAWNHVALTRNGSTWTLWLNGVSVASGSASFTMDDTGTLFVYGTDTTPNSYPFTGYSAGFRMVKGTSLYNTSFVPPTSPPTAVTNTSLLLNFTNAGIPDAAAKNVLETVGGAAISTAQSKFGGSAMYFDGSGDYLSMVETAILNFGSGDFTIEAWIYATATVGANRPIWSTGTNSTNWMSLYLHTTAGRPEFAIISGGSTIIDLFPSDVVSTNTWYHLAVTRSGSTFRMFLNGTVISSGTSATAVPDYTDNYRVGYGRWNGDTGVYAGYINDLRITRGYARYTANFTAPTAAFPTQ